MKRYDQQVHMWSALPFVDKYLRFQTKCPCEGRSVALPKKQNPTKTHTNDTDLQPAK